MGAYPVAFDLPRPRRFQRAHVVVRLLILTLAALVGGGLFSVLYLVFPLAAAVIVSQKGGRSYVAEDGPRVTTALRWVVAVIAYLAILTDRLPMGGEEPVRLHVRSSGSPTPASALLRLLYAVPSALVLVLLGVAAAGVWVVAAVSILAGESYPPRLWRFQRGVVRWQARLLAYLASLVEPYPPFRLDTGDEPPAVS